MRIAVLVPEFPALTQTFTYIRLGKLAEKGICINLFYSNPGDFSLLETSLIKRMTNAGVVLTKLPGDRLSVKEFFRLLLKGNIKINLELSLKFLKKIRYKASIRESLSALFRFAPLIFWQPQIIHIETSYLVHGMLRALEASQKPILISLRGADVDEKPITSEIWRDFYSSTQDRPLLFFHCVSEYIRTKAVRLGIPKEKCITIYSGVNLEPREQDITSFDPASQITKVITVSRLSHEKGIDLALEAMSHLRESGLTIQYNIIGDGPERLNLESQAEERKFHDCVIFWGAQTNDWVRAFLFDNSNNSIYLQPSRFEAFGLSILEASFSSLPIVATNVGGIPEIISDEETGLLCEPNDPALMAVKIKKLIDDDYLRQIVRHNGYILATENFTDQIEAENFINLYSQLIQTDIS